MKRDGVIEVGGMYIPKGFEDAAMAEIPFIYTYNDYRIDGSKQIYDASNTKLKETKDTVFYTDMKEDLVIPNDNFHLLQDEF